MLESFSNFIKKRQTPTQVFSCEYCEIFKNTYSEEHLRTVASVQFKDYLRHTGKVGPGTLRRDLGSRTLRWDTKVGP